MLNIIVVIKNYSALLNSLIKIIIKISQLLNNLIYQKNI